MREFIESVLFSVCVVGLYIGLPLWCFHCLWLPWTADIIEKAVHKKDDEMK